MIILMYILVYIFGVAFATVLFSTYGQLPFKIPNKYTIQDVKYICLIIMTIVGITILMHILNELDSISYQQEIIIELLRGSK